MRTACRSLVESVSPDVRAMLALFCYRRSHLHALAVAIAASCTERELIEIGGRVGSTLYALSREAGRRAPPSASSRRPQADHAVDQAALDACKPLEDELDDEDLAKPFTA